MKTDRLEWCAKCRRTRPTYETESMDEQNPWRLLCCVFCRTVIGRLGPGNEVVIYDPEPTEAEKAKAARVVELRQRNPLVRFDHPGLREAARRMRDE